MIELPEEIVKYVLERKTNPAFAYDELKLYSSIKKEIETINNDILKIKQKAKLDIEQLLYSRPDCPHPVKEYHGDPSGGSDSHYLCLLCREILK